MPQCFADAVQRLPVRSGLSHRRHIGQRRQDRPQLCGKAMGIAFDFALDKLLDRFAVLFPDLADSVVDRIVVHNAGRLCQGCHGWKTVHEGSLQRGALFLDLAFQIRAEIGVLLAGIQKLVSADAGFARIQTRKLLDKGGKGFFQITVQIDRNGKAVDPPDFLHSQTFKLQNAA